MGKAGVVIDPVQIKAPNSSAADRVYGFGGV